MSNRPSSPCVSIVLPVRNGERYLKEALDSVLAQTFAEFELICVDDASGDSTLDILTAAAKRDDRVRIIANEDKRGLPASLDAGFGMARGELHSWIGHDDRMRPELLAVLTGFLAAHPSCDFVYSAYAEMDEAGVPARLHPERPAGNLLLGNIVGRSFLYRACIWQDLGGHDHELECVEDYDFCLRARRQFTLCPVEEVLFDYRIHSRSLTSTRQDDIEHLHDRLLEREIPLEGNAEREAEAWLHLMQLYPDIARLRYLPRALARKPHVVFRDIRAILRWMKASVSGRRGASPPPAH